VEVVFGLPGDGINAEQALHFAESLARGEPNRKKIALTTISDQVRELI
jgi:pyruvate dehydrogenase (quinone)/pyruvate oxidase